MDLDADLEELDRAALIAEAKALRAGIRDHRDSTRHTLCWHHPQLWSLLPEKTEPDIEIPEWPHFMRGCIAYRTSLDQQRPEAPRVASDYDEKDQVK